ncbi:MAG: hypothetical protein M3Q29_03685 [Chloroflexota bacterium]|nr:hypothetical protein [Chloroflexota bacterium]
MSQGDSDTVVMIVNEIVTGRPDGNLEADARTLTGVQAVDVTRPGVGGLARKVTITYDTGATNPLALRAELEEKGYAVTALQDSDV